MIRLLSVPMIVTAALSFLLAVFFRLLATRIRLRGGERSRSYYAIFSSLAAVNGLFLTAFSVTVNASENLYLLDVANRLTIIAAMFTIALSIHFFTSFFSVKPPIPMTAIYAVCLFFTGICCVSNDLFLARRFYRTCSYYVGLEFGPLFRVWGLFIGLVSVYGLVVLLLVFRRARRQNDGANRSIIVSLIAASSLWLLTALADNLTGIQVLDLPPLSWIGAFSTILVIALVLLRHIDTLYDDRRQLFDKLIHDHLTGAFSRSYLELRLAEKVRRVARDPDQEAWLVLVDIDDFKVVNDRLGHAAGDQVLREVVLVIRRSLRETDLVARLGGDELAILVTDVHRAGHAREVVERVRCNIANHTFRWRGQGFPVTCSFGMTHLAAGVDELENAVEELLITADTALYDSKHAGKNRVSVRNLARVKTFTPRLVC